MFLTKGWFYAIIFDDIVIEEIAFDKLFFDEMIFNKPTNFIFAGQVPGQWRHRQEVNRDFDRRHNRKRKRNRKRLEPLPRSSLRGVWPLHGDAQFEHGRGHRRTKGHFRRPLKSLFNELGKSRFAEGYYLKSVVCTHR